MIFNFKVKIKDQNLTPYEKEMVETFFVTFHDFDKEYYHNKCGKDANLFVKLFLNNILPNQTDFVEDLVEKKFDITNPKKFQFFKKNGYASEKINLMAE